MSTLKVNDIIEATSGGGKIWPSRAWANFTGTGTATLNDDGNVGSLTDNGTGDITLNFSSSFSNANYAANFTCTIRSGVYNILCGIRDSGTATGSVRLMTNNFGSPWPQQDTVVGYFVAHGS